VINRVVNPVVCFVAIFFLAASTNFGADTARVWVQFVPGQKVALKRALQDAGGRIHYEFDDLRAIAVSVPAAALNGLQHNPNIALIEEDAPRELLGQTIPYGIDAVQARDVWDANRDGIVNAGAPTGAGCKVCVIDTGVYAAHEDLAGLNIAGESGTPTAWNIDGCGHGTHVVGTIVAANNALGVVGVTPGAAPIYMVKVFGDDCSWAYSSDLVYAANRCKAVGARIISMSLGGATKSLTEESAFQSLYNQGVLSVAAAGNSGNTSYSYPASYSSVISVAAVDQNNVVASFSQKNDQVELAAPGVSVLSTVPILSDLLTVDGAPYIASHIENAAYGTVTAPLVNGGRATSTSASWAGKVVLVERGDISFYQKVLNVQNSGGLATVIYNNAPGSFSGTLGAGNSSTIPAVSISQEDGQYLIANKLGFLANVKSNPQQTGSGYAYYDGTSMATPHVSAVAALVWSSNLTRTDAQIRDALQKSAKDLGPVGRDTSYGYGLVQAKAALDYLNGSAPPPPTVTTARVASITYKTQSGKNQTRDLVVTLTVRNNLGNAVSGASVSIRLFRNASLDSTANGTTASDGTVSFVLRNAASGTYTTTVTALTAAGLSWDGVTPSNSFVKQ
jgi:subtilisin family serine protease